MGSLIYGVAPAIQIEDRVLRHLQLVMIQKLRRNESFGFNWEQDSAAELDDATDEDGSHGAIWVSPSSQLYFRFDGPRKNVQLNRVWLDQLMQATYSAEGLSALPEPKQD